MKRLVLVFFFISSLIKTNAQDEKVTSVSFCGKIIADNSTRSSFTVQELRTCNLVIVPEDTSLQVNSFYLIIVPLNDPVDIREIPVSGAKIPQRYIETLCAAKLFRLERIALSDRNKNILHVLPAVFSVQP